MIVLGIGAFQWVLPARNTFLFSSSEHFRNRSWIFFASVELSYKSFLFTSLKRDPTTTTTTTKTRDGTARKKMFDHIFIILQIFWAVNEWVFRKVAAHSTQHKVKRTEPTRKGKNYAISVKRRKKAYFVTFIMLLKEKIPYDFYINSTIFFKATIVT